MKILNLVDALSYFGGFLFVVMLSIVFFIALYLIILDRRLDRKIKDVNQEEWNQNE